MAHHFYYWRKQALLVKQIQFFWAYVPESSDMF